MIDLSVYTSTIKIVTDDALMSMTVEDWSRVRSPSRALRRFRLGHRQNIDLKVVPKKEVIVIDRDSVGETWIVHSMVRAELERELRHRIDSAVNTAMAYGVNPAAACNTLLMPSPSSPWGSICATK